MAAGCSDVSGVGGGGFLIFFGLTIFGLGGGGIATFSWLASALDDGFEVYRGGVPRVDPLLVDPVSYSSEYFGGFEGGGCLPLPTPSSTLERLLLLLHCPAPLTSGLVPCTSDLMLDVLLQAASLEYFLSSMKFCGLRGTKLNLSLFHLGSFSQSCCSSSRCFWRCMPRYTGMQQ